MTSTVGSLIVRHDFNRLSMGIWRTANYLKSVNSVGKKRTKSPDSFIVGARAVRANVLSLSANAIISLAVDIFYETIANIEIIVLWSYLDWCGCILTSANRQVALTGRGY
ncbi:hypothetical protein [Burkholderia ubonensis]|uniref:hypothetical protein n=1 Tax=Burkholderia ubonensis TaxID=101571 RepID=UPI0010545540|nr:hypothetical protein [Burkholderia ubonensis]